MKRKLGLIAVVCLATIVGLFSTMLWLQWVVPPSNDDFSMHISVNKTEFYLGEPSGIMITATLKNHTWRTYQFRQWVLMMPRVPGAEHARINTRFRGTGGVIFSYGRMRRSLPLCSYVEIFEPGIHELSVNASFVVNYNWIVQRRIVVRSNVIEITVLER